MSEKTLKEKLKETIKKQKTEEDLEQKFDPQEQINEFKYLVEKLYSLAEDAVSDLISENLITVSRESKSIFEESLGSYEIDCLVFSINSKKIKFIPYGTMLIASKGRVDVTGPYGEEKFMLIRKGVRSARDLIHVKVSIVGGEEEKKTETETTKKITVDDWEWKTASNDNYMKFSDVTQEAITEIILRMING